MNEIRTLDLFSGIGGFSLGLRRAGGFRTVAYCEKEPALRDGLVLEMRRGRLDVAPICTDVCRLDGEPLRGKVDLICGGFPCQDISGEGAKAGIAGPRSGLWHEYARLIREIRPRFVLVENVADLAIRGMDVVLGTLSVLGYDAEWSLVSACSVGAPHVRERMFVVAYPHALGLEGWLQERQGLGAEALSAPEAWRQLPGPYVCEAPYGVPGRLVHIGGPGNAVVPAVAEWIGRQIMRVQS